MHTRSELEIISTMREVEDHGYPECVCNLIEWEAVTEDWVAIHIQMYMEGK